MEGKVSALQFLLENGVSYPPDSDPCQSAAYVGHLDVLKCLRKHGCPWSETTTDMAVRNGNFEVFKWAVENGCPVHPDNCKRAARLGYYPLVKWIIEKGCPFNPADIIALATKDSQWEIVDMCNAKIEAQKIHK